MKCPTCADQVLVMSERHGVEIDYCPQCRGVWLDRGELDKLLDRAETAPPLQAGEPRGDRQRESSYPSRDHEHSWHGHKKHYRHKSWLSEIFD